jgi:hypothetical protein
MRYDFVLEKKVIDMNERREYTRLYVSYLMRWKIITTNYSFIEVVDLRQRTSFVFQGHESVKLLEKWNEVKPLLFLDWFYDNGLNLSVDPVNYELTDEDIQYMKQQRTMLLA